MIYMRNKDKDGKTVEIPFDCEEQFIAYCGHYGKELIIELEEFDEYVNSGTLWDSNIFCNRDCLYKEHPDIKRMPADPSAESSGKIITLFSRQ